MCHELLRRLARFSRLAWGRAPPGSRLLSFLTGCPPAAVSALLILQFAYGRGAAQEPRNTDWKLLGNSNEAQHWSSLSQINPKTVSRLGLAWSVEIDTRDGLVGNPLVEGGIVFQSGARGQIFANDVRTGARRWTFVPPYTYPNSAVGDWASRYNRGLALTNDLAIVGTGNCELIAVDQKTGRKRWEVTAC